MLSLPLGDMPQPVAIAVAGHGPGLCRYALPGLWQLHLYPYACRAEIAGESLAIRPGSAGITPPGAVMRYRMGAQQAHTYAHFTANGETVEVPSLVDCGRDFAVIEERLRSAAGLLQIQPRQAAVRLWDILHEVVGHAPRQAGDVLVEQACDLIEQRLATRLRVAAIARQLGISHSQLDRRFRAVMGSTVVAFLRVRRARLAQHLLQHSDLPVGLVARQVGVGDLHALNKLLRREYGHGPRHIRAAGSGARIHR